MGFVEYLISQALTRWPAAVLFAISGFLFFHDLQPLWAVYRRKYAGRVRLWGSLRSQRPRGRTSRRRTRG